MAVIIPTIFTYILIKINKKEYIDIYSYRSYSPLIIEYKKGYLYWELNSIVYVNIIK